MRTRVLFALFMALTAACGVRGEAAPHALDYAALPPEQAPAPSPETGIEPETRLFLLRDERLVEVRRAEQPGLAEAVRLLVAGATDAEATTGLRSAIPSATKLLHATVDGGTARIDLDESFTSVVGPEQILAVAQLVFTATAIDGIDDVTVAIDGQRVDVPTGEGRLTSGPVSRAHYPSLAPE